MPTKLWGSDDGRGLQLCLTHISRQLNLNKKAKRNERKAKMPEKQYINKCKIVEKTFDDGGSLLNVALNVDELVEIAEPSGWVNLTIAKRREPSEKGATHYAYRNEFKPKTDDGLPF